MAKTTKNAIARLAHTRSMLGVSGGGYLDEQKWLGVCKPSAGALARWRLIPATCRSLQHLYTPLLIDWPRLKGTLFKDTVPQVVSETSSSTQSPPPWTFIFPLHESLAQTQLLKLPTRSPTSDQWGQFSYEEDLVARSLKARSVRRSPPRAMAGAPVGLTWLVYTDSSAVKQDEEDMAIIKSHAMRVVHRERPMFARKTKLDTQKARARTLHPKPDTRSLTKDDQRGLRGPGVYHSVERTYLTPNPNNTTSISKTMCQPDSTALKSRAFQYFCENTIPMLLYVNPSPSAYYLIQCLIPQAFNVEPAITHSIVAAATAHENAFQSSVPPVPLAAVALKHYGKSLHTIADKTAPPTTLVTLMACLIFIAYETLQETPKKAALHLENGLRILREWKQRHHASNIHTLSPQDQLIRQYLEPVYAHLETMFSRSSVSAMNTIGDLDYSPPILPGWFTSLLEVRGKMLELVLYFLGRHPPESITAEEQLQLLPIWQSWVSKMSLFTQDLPKWPIRNQLHARLLHVHADMLLIALQCQHHENETVWDEYLDRLQTILTTCYDICHHAETYKPSSNPNDMDFGITPGVLPPLWLIGTSCRDPNTRRRAIELLRLHHRHCGHTDDCSAALLAETIMQLEEAGIPLTRTGADVPEGRRVRALEADLTRPGTLALTYARAPDYSARSRVDVPYVSTTPLPVRTYRLWPIVGTMTCVGYRGLIRPSASSCICKAYGQ